MVVDDEASVVEVVSLYLRRDGFQVRVASDGRQALDLIEKAVEEQATARDSVYRGDALDTLIVAISQSGTTTDTNRTVDMVRERGAHTIAIVNRRDSDITFKADGVMYTSSGRDIEMSVASTKAFYSQIVACALVGLNIAGIQKRRSAAFIRKGNTVPSAMTTNPTPPNPILKTRRT